jgi:hypothetical protein
MQWDVGQVMVAFPASPSEVMPTSVRLYPWALSGIPFGRVYEPFAHPFGHVHYRLWGRPRSQRLNAAAIG